MSSIEFSPTPKAVEAAPIASLASFILQIHLSRDPQGTSELDIPNLLGAAEAHGVLVMASHLFQITEARQAT